ncbi:MAG: class II aldolase/adducin family protein [Gammaproteobacteria bacterium]|nr:class II aldolase/adducin family protein [Gammaproteobacteria bacterium]
MTVNKIRNEIITTARLFNETGMSVGTSGNLSARAREGFLITPTGVPYEDMTPDDIIEMNLNGKVVSGKLKPSTEWPFHKAIYVSRKAINAIVHVHSPYATGISCTRQDIPAFHYMVALVGGDSVRCAKYATFGTEELSRSALAALKDRRACLLANHGMIALGEDIKSAYRLAEEVENLAMQYWISKQIGTPVLLDNAEMKVNKEKFKTYGKQKVADELDRRK